jgi:circadian clock protein KaiC
MTVGIQTRISAGVAGLDNLLPGGLLAQRTYLVSGAPGTGKTLFGLSFLTSVSAGANGLYVGFTQSEEHIREDAASAGIATDRIKFLDLTPDADVFSRVQTYDIFSPTEVEREPIMRAIRTQIEELRPERIFIDGFSEVRMISSDMFQFLRLTQSFFRFANGQGATVLISNTEGLTDIDIALQSAADGVFHLVGCTDVRSIEVTKMRGGEFVCGLHPMRITRTGIAILPDSA